MKGAGLVPPEPEMGIKMDNFVSMYARPAEDEDSIQKKMQEKEIAVKMELAVEVKERKEEMAMDEEALKRQFEMTEEEKKAADALAEEKAKINSDLYLAEKGLKSIDEVVDSLENMRQKAKVNNYFEEE